MFFLFTLILTTVLTQVPSSKGKISYFIESLKHQFCLVNALVNFFSIEVNLPRSFLPNFSGWLCHPGGT
jgi:hypothetical protein